MTSNDPDLAGVVEAIADGRDVDWSAVRKAKGAAPDDLDELAVIAALAAVHRQQIGPSTPSTGPDAGPPTRSSPDLAHAAPWGPLLLLEEVADGAFGRVYRAWDPKLDHEVALKRLRLPAHTPQSQAAVIVREGQLLARVRHENVVTVHGACEVDGEVGIWMDFVHGKTLDVIVHEAGPMSAQEATIIGDSLCRALAAVHHAGLLHRDIKATNVMREAGGRIVMLDFGAGTEMHSELGGLRMIGTPVYMAPELFDRGAPTAASDIYSLGVVLFYLVTGSYPVPGRSLAEIRASHQAGRRRLLSDVRPDLPQRFVKVIECALAPSAADRYQSAGAMLRDLTGGEIPAEPVVRTGSALRIVVTAVVSAVLGVMLMGALTSGAFNRVLERSEFAAETPTDWLTMGARSTVGAIVLFTLVALVITIAVAVWRVACRASKMVRAVEKFVRGQLSRGATALRLHDASELASWLLVLSTMLLVWAYFRFSGMLDAVTSTASTAPSGILALLSHEMADYQVQYRQALEGLVIFQSVAWVALFRLAARWRQKIAVGYIVAASAAIVLTVASLTVPYRLIFHSQFRAAEWQGNDCYVTGENSSDILLFCPDLAPPRNRVVQKPTDAVHRLDRIELIFSRFAPTNTPRPSQPASEPR